MLVNKIKIVLLVCYFSSLQSFFEYYYLQKNSEKLLIISDVHIHSSLIRQTGQKMLDGIFQDIENKNLPKIKFMYEVSKAYFEEYKIRGISFLAGDPRGVDPLIKMFLDYNIKFKNSNFPIDFQAADPRISSLKRLTAYFINLGQLLKKLNRENIQDFKNSSEFKSFKEKYSGKLFVTFSQYNNFLDIFYNQLKSIADRTKQSPLYIVIEEQFKNYENAFKKIKKYYSTILTDFNENSSLAELITKLIEQENTTKDATQKYKYFYNLMIKPVNKFYADTRYFIEIINNFESRYKNICLYIGLNHARHLVQMFIKYGFKGLKTVNPYFDQKLKIEIIPQNFDQKLFDEYFENLKKTFYRLFENETAKESTKKANEKPKRPNLKVQEKWKLYKKISFF
ncbi:hypothetical protein M1446_03320 [Candidatus Dependentiae bacterium]|nr:hypothetical protein [Candidatus Dependentiae bacterium]